MAYIKYDSDHDSMLAQPVKGEGRRGRPPRLSRDAVLVAAVDMLERRPEVAFSLNGLARDLGVSSMALYTYFGSSHDLLQALTDRMLGGLVFEVAADATPAETIAAWCNGVRAFFLRHPQLIHILTWEGGGASIAWFDRAVLLVDALKRTGLAGEDLARAILWVWSVIMGAINLELRNRAAPQVITADQLVSMDPSLHGPVGVMLQMVERPDHFDSFYAYQVERLLDALNAMTTVQSK